MLKIKLLLLSIVMSILLITSWAYAGTITVNSTGDTNSRDTVITLREAIELSEGTLAFGSLTPLVRPGGLILAHNINPRQADPEYVKAITANPDLETIFLHKDSAGVSVTLKKH